MSWWIPVVVVVAVIVIYILGVRDMRRRYWKRDRRGGDE